MEQSESMSIWEITKAASQKARSWIRGAADALPPYYVIEGEILDRRAGRSGEPLIIVNGAPISVDRPTFDSLAVGQRVKVRYTRAARAISIDVFTAPGRSA